MGCWMRQVTAAVRRWWPHEEPPASSPVHASIPYQPKGLGSHQPAPLSPTSPAVPSLTWCPSYLSRLCFFPVFFFFSLRMGEELSQLGGWKVGALEEGARDSPALSPWPRGVPSHCPSAPRFPWTTHGMHEHHMEVISWGEIWGGG